MIHIEIGKSFINGSRDQIKTELRALGKMMQKAGPEFAKIKEEITLEWMKETTAEKLRLAEVTFRIATLPEEEREKIRQQMEENKRL